MWKPALVAAFLLVVGLSQSAAGATAQSPSLRVTHRTPLVVSGSSFSHAERLVVSAAGAGRTERHSVTTSASGTFTATFTLHIDPCLSGTTITARRAGHSTTLVQLKIPARACPPAP